MQARAGIGGDRRSGGPSGIRRKIGRTEEPGRSFLVSPDMATHGDNGIDGTKRPCRAGDAPRRAAAGVPGTDSDQWHRMLTGRQSPEPVTAKLRMIYGRIVAEKLPDHMLDLLSRIDQKSSRQ